jgi:hypothetical protein
VGSQEKIVIPELSSFLQNWEPVKWFFHDFAENQDSANLLMMNTCVS